MNRSTIWPGPLPEPRSALNLIFADEFSRTLDQYQTIDCRFSLTDTLLGERQYAEGHIPGAYYAHLDQHLSSPITPQSGRHPLPDFDVLSIQLGRWGIDLHTPVVVYDNASGGHAYAARLWWLLKTLGHPQVKVLNGGIDAWQNTGQVLETHQANPVPAQFRPHLNRDNWRNTQQVQVALTEKTGVVVDARAPERFDGKFEPIDPIAGHIPGSVNMPVSNNLDASGLFKAADSLRKNYLDVIENVPAEQVIHSCGSGVFACLGVLAMELAELHGSKIYPGSWSEWIRDPARGVATSDWR